MSTNVLTISQNVEVSVNTELFVGWPDLLQARPYLFIISQIAVQIYYNFFIIQLKPFDVTDLYKWYDDMISYDTWVWLNLMDIDLHIKPISNI